jgi:hypothetical protein
MYAMALRSGLRGQGFLLQCPVLETFDDAAVCQIVMRAAWYLDEVF